MFYLTYLRQELRRRIGRTIFTVCGLAVGVALVVAVTALSAGLRRAQSQVLGPLASVGTDMTVTKQSPIGGKGFGVPLGAPTLQTDLSKLGKAGERYSTDTFFSTMPSFTPDEVEKIAGTDGVRTTSSALQLRGIHQEGTIPDPAAGVQSGTQRPSPRPLTEDERKKMAACLSEGGSSQAVPDPNLDPLDSVFQGIGRCLPESFRSLRTDITSGQFTIAGIEPQAPLGLVSPDQVLSGHFLTGDGEAMLSESYAASRQLEVGSTLKLKDRSYTVVGLTKPPLAGDSADIYLALDDLQQVAEREGESNVILARAADASKVEAVSSAIRERVAGTYVSDSSQVTRLVSGSLVDSGTLIRRLGIALGVVGILAAVLLAALLTLSSVAKRTRELGTLKAIGWGPALVVRQIMAESAAQGVLGAALGIGLGLGAAALIGAFGPSLSAQTAPRGPGRLFGFGGFGEQATEVVRLTAPIRPSTIVLGAVLAVLGGLVAGGIGAMRAARLRPADAMREVS